MFASKIIMELLPNIHLIGMFIVSFTVVFRWKALYPIYIFVIITGLYNGFATWWIPYLYIWSILWAITMLIPKNIPKRIACFVYPIISALFGFAYGTLYAPMQALLFGLDFDGMAAWIIAGLPFDIIHGISNFATGLLILPLSELIKKILQKSY